MDGCFWRTNDGCWCVMSIIFRNSHLEVFLGKVNVLSYVILINFIPLLQLYTNHNQVNKIRKQLPRGGLKKRCSENMQQITGENPWTLWHGYSPVNLLRISEHLFLRTTLDGYLRILLTWLWLVDNCNNGLKLIKII